MALPPDQNLTAAPPADLREADSEPPVVARLVVEIRSDGTRTIARGALEDRTSGEQVAVKAEGTTPAALAAALARSLFQLPSLQKRTGVLRQVARRLLPGTKKR